MTHALFPDIEAMAARILRAANVCGGRCYSSIPKNPVWPLATVKRVGGTPAVERWLDVARIQVDVWGNNKSEARSSADAARLALHNGEGVAYGVDAGFLSGVEDELGLTFLPDPETSRDHYLFVVRMYAHRYTT